MAANNYTNLADLIENNPDPDAGDIGASDRAFRTGPGAAAEGELFPLLAQPVPVVAYLAHESATQSPMVLSMPFSADRPGNADNQGFLYATVGDVTAHGTTPALVALSEDLLATTAAADVPTLATLDAVWTARPNGQHGVDIPPADVEQVTTRGFYPIPHEYAPQMLRAQSSGLLTWSWVWEHIMEPILADAALIPHYQGLIDFFRVATTLLPDDAAGDPQPAQTAWAYQPIYLQPRPMDMHGRLLAMHLGGMRAPTNQEAQLQRMAANTERLATNAANSAPAEKTLLTELPFIAELALKVSEKQRVQDLPLAWANYHKLQKGGTLAWLTQHAAKAASDNNTAAPVFPPAYALDFSNGAWKALRAEAITDGIGPARIMTMLSEPNQLNQRLRENHTFNALTQLDGNNGRAVEIALSEAGRVQPKDCIGLQAWAQAWYNTAESLWGANSSYTLPIKEQLLDHMQTIIQHISSEHRNNEHHVILIIVAYCCRLSQVKLRDMIDKPLPTAAVPTPSTYVPPYRNIVDSLGAGTIRFLTSVPPSMLDPAAAGRMPVPGASPAPAPALAPAPAPAPAGQQPPNRQNNQGAGNDRQEVRNLDQNPRLKQGWTNTGETGLFGEGRRFFDADGPRRRKVIMRLAGNRQQYICIPHACRGVCFSSCRGYHGLLTPPEEQAVAEAGGFPLDL